MQFVCVFGLQTQPHLQPVDVSADVGAMNDGKNFVRHSIINQEDGYNMIAHEFEAIAGYFQQKEKRKEEANIPDAFSLVLQSVKRDQGPSSQQVC